jgi:hypothetical protein
MFSTRQFVATAEIFGHAAFWQVRRAVEQAGCKASGETRCGSRAFENPKLSYNLVSEQVNEERQKQRETGQIPEAIYRAIAGRKGTLAGQRDGQAYRRRAELSLAGVDHSSDCRFSILLPEAWSFESPRKICSGHPFRHDERLKSQPQAGIRR